MKTSGSTLHKILDVDPWIILGNTRELHSGDWSRRAQLAGAVISGGATALGNDFENIGQGINSAGNKINEWKDDAVDWYKRVNNPIGKE